MWTLQLVFDQVYVKYSINEKTFNIDNGRGGASMELNNKRFPALRKYLYYDLPLGPIDSSDIKDPFVHEILFERNNRIYEKISKRPSVIVGRRGSGKTAFLTNIARSRKFGVVINLKSAEAFSRIVAEVDREITKKGFLLPEEVSNLWDFLFWSVLASAVRDKYPSDSGIAPQIH